MEEKIVCACFNISEEAIEKVIKVHKLTTVSQVREYTKAGSGGKNCKGNAHAT